MSADDPGRGPPADDEPYEEEEVEQLDANHPTLAPVQEILRKQITNRLSDARNDLAHKEEELKQARKEREDLGVELYQAQQHLAELQTHLEQAHENWNTVNQMREAAEEDLKRVRADHAASLADVKAQRNKQDKYQVDLDKLNATLAEVEKYTDDMKGEIAVTRRVTYKAEEDISRMESAKKQQDLLIDRLEEQLRSLHERYELHEAQLAAQREETRTATATLGDAEKEMEQISYEKKQLLAQWKSVLIAMQQRNEALQATMDAINRQREQEAAIEGEIRGNRKALAKAQELHETLTGQHRRVLMDKAEAERIIAQNTERHEKLTEKLLRLEKSLEKVEEDLAAASTEKQAAEDELNATEGRLQKATQELKRLEAERLNAISEQTSLDKAAQNVKATIEKTYTAIAEAEMATAAEENRLARVRVDALHTEAANAELRERLEEHKADLKAKDALIAKYDQEIKRRNDEISKKEQQVNQLTRKLDGLKEKAGLDAAKAKQEEEEQMGPLEATIRELQDEIVLKGKESEEMQRQWIQGQTQLVGVERSIDTKSARMQERGARLTILNQKRLKIDGQFSSEQRELEQLERSVDAMHLDMTRINELTAQHRRLKERLVDDTKALEQTFVARLKAKEAEALEQEAAIARLKEEKERILADCEDAERRAILWSKKIELERETQAALDPNVGATEVKSMQNEIQRMRLRYDQLRKLEQEKIKEMERAVYKRDSIGTKGRTAAARSTGETQASLRKAIGTISERLKTMTHDAHQTIADVRELRGRQAEVARALDGLQARKREVLAQEESLHAAVQTQEIERAFHETEVHKNERVIGTVRAALQGEGELEPEGVLREQLQAAQEEAESAVEVAQLLMESFPACESQIRAIMRPQTVGSVL